MPSKYFVGAKTSRRLPLAVVIRQQAFERLKIVPMHHQIVMQAYLVCETFGLHRFQFMIRHEQMKVLHERFAFEIQ